MDSFDEEPWLDAVRQGDLCALPDPLTWDQTLHFAHLINGYRVSHTLGWGELRVWANERRDTAVQAGVWTGSALELWCCLFYEHRRYRHMGEGDPQGGELALLNGLCAAVQRTLAQARSVEHRLILRFIAAGL